ncbi:hypothetical protein [Dokdonella sp.]|uniref:hypothetical protein n=1 Tax=Dokdonella sp. TaxID=2291710 RepID=UPI002F408AA1
MPMRRIVLAVALALSSSPASTAAPAAKDAFERLKSLAGDWRSARPGSATVVDYRAIANGAALVERWTMSPTRQSMTVYTMDGDRLLATHYCPQGNAPRLRLEAIDASGAYRFEFVDGANLQDPQGSHEHAFWLRIDAQGRITRGETYVRNGSDYDPSRDMGEVETFVRTK